MNILTEASRSVESKIMEHEGFYKELIRNNMFVEIEIRQILREMCNQQLTNERLSLELEQKLGEVSKQNIQNWVFKLISTEAVKRLLTLDSHQYQSV